jgi:site-specific DNA-cytosine methylase
MNVLSLFDGISCGQIALNRAGIDYDSYFASEVDRYAIRVTQAHYPNTIQLGDVRKISVKNLPAIDLLIGGSPCKGFSFGGKGLGFTDEESKLFFEYVRILEECKPKYFLFENVEMKNKYHGVISQHLGTEPLKINSSFFSMQNRTRLYWTNIPVPEFNGEGVPCFGRYLYRLGHGYVKDEVKFFMKYPALTAQPPGTKYRIVIDLDIALLALSAGDLALLRNDQITRSATPEECEEFQTLPRLYTAMLSQTQRYRCIGNAWTVDVIAHIFKGMSF